jgi:hypothetical protein
VTSTPEEPSDDGTDDTPPDLDAAFNAIVSNLRHGERPPEVPRWPANEDLPKSGEDPVTDKPAPQLGSQWSGWEDITVEQPEEHAEVEPDEHYVPPAPPPVPQGDRIVRWAWAGAIGAPVVALVLAVGGWNLAGIVGALLVGAFLGGFVTLVSRMRPDRTLDDGPDDGAVV